MSGILLSGPAGGGKSQLARDLLREATEPTVAADFQAIVVALLLLERGPGGKYPIRPRWVLPIAERVRQSVITAANERGINLVVTNSDGARARRELLLARIRGVRGESAVERIVDPDPPRIPTAAPPRGRRSRGEELARARLADPITGVLSPECEKAIQRWYGRVNRG